MIPDGVRLKELKRLAIQLRRLVVESVHHAGAGHLGGPMSAADMLICLYFEVLNIDPERPEKFNRDRFILSKGHSSIGLYAALALRGYFPVEELKTFDEINSRLQGHPAMDLLPGIDMSSGSLGQGLSPGVGMAIASKTQGSNFRTFVMLGDGDSQEGQIWEAAMIAGRYQLNNLTAILDLNNLQQYGWATPEGYKSSNRIPPQEDAISRWQAFGWNTIEINGHDMIEFIEACSEAKTYTEGPTIIIAKTIKGKGISYMENDFSWHSKPVTNTDLENAIIELKAQEAAL
ncbi:MAG: transketolase [Gemmatimonadetes bacterium]|jgi:transketolase|nr:transketolase [Gemmatimonadota bacterium]|tara:strand:- start:72 stop:938 length:867 start_codon:yes stop_codon:yes gene_type:complete